MQLLKEYCSLILVIFRSKHREGTDSLLAELARVGVFSEKETSAPKLDTIYPYHRRELGVGWRRNSTK